MASKLAEKVPGWVGRFLLPEIQQVVEKQVGTLRVEMNARLEAIEKTMNVRFETLEKTLNIRFEAVEETMNAKFEAVNARLDGIEKRFNLVQDVAILKAEVKEMREKLASR